MFAMPFRIVRGNQRGAVGAQGSEEERKRGSDGEAVL
jgi:hypothetical protein